MRKRLRIGKNKNGYKVLKKAFMMCIVGLSLFGGVMTSYAAGPGEVNTQTVAKPVTYTQQSVKALGSWEKQSDGSWVFKQHDGTLLTNSWIESLTETGAYYFVGADGLMLVNSQTPDGYTVDGNGVWRQASGLVDNTQIEESTETNPRYVDGDEVGEAPNPADYSNADDYYEARARWLTSQPSYKKYMDENMNGAAYDNMLR